MKIYSLRKDHPFGDVVTFTKTKELAEHIAKFLELEKYYIYAEYVRTEKPGCWTTNIKTGKKSLIEPVEEMYDEDEEDHELYLEASQWCREENKRNEN